MYIKRTGPIGFYREAEQAMGWKENGKYGVTTGRTVRSSFASRWHSKAPQESELLLKFTRGTGGLSSFELEEFLTQNDIEDGLGDFTESTTRLVRARGVDRSSKVPYSLKKRKRWLLSENANAPRQILSILRKRLLT